MTSPETISSNTAVVPPAAPIIATATSDQPLHLELTAVMDVQVPADAPQATETHPENGLKAGVDVPKEGDADLGQGNETGKESAFTAEKPGEGLGQSIENALLSSPFENLPAELQGQSVDNMAAQLHAAQINPLAGLSYDYSFDAATISALLDPIGPLDQLPELPHMSQIQTADPMDAVQGSVGMNGLMEHQYLAEVAPVVPPIQAFAKIEFDDSSFYVNTYQITIGRDQQAAREALKRDAEALELQRAETAVQAESNQEPQTPVRKKNGSGYSRSVVSESAGILREGDDPPYRAERKERKRYREESKRSRSTGSSSHPYPATKNGSDLNNAHHTRTTPAKRSTIDANGATPAQGKLLRPSPYENPTIGIHPSSDFTHKSHKAISRRHILIAYSEDKSVFQAIIFGRNGAFIDEVFYPRKSVVDLKSGSEIQIADVVLRFILPDVVSEIPDLAGPVFPLQEGGELVEERYSQNGKDMSFRFEDSFREPNARDTSADSSSREPLDINDDDGDDEDNSGEAEECEEDGVEESADELEIEGEDTGSQIDDDDEHDLRPEIDDEPDLQAPSQPSYSQKKRGPGRPPKDGIASKRAQQQAKKEAAMAALAQPQSKKESPGPQSAPTAKAKVGRPRKNPEVPKDLVQKEKRKYTKRKPKEPKTGDSKEDGSGAEVKEKKKEKPPKPPRSPSPEFNEAELTPEQLAKPTSNYVILIHEALTQSSTGLMTLPQIYRAIVRKYPFFKLRCTTNGWQSSVRHNLGQHPAFQKVLRNGKGWTWGLVDGVSVEKDKKRKASPPPPMSSGQMHQPIYQAPYGQMPPYPNYPILRPGQHPQYMAPMPMTGQPYHSGQHLQMNGQPPHPGYMPSIPQLAPITAPQQYSSPYAKAPAPSTENQTPVEQKPPPPNPSPLSAPQPLQQQEPQTQSQQPQQHRPITAPAGHPQHPQSVLDAVEAFRSNFTPGFKAKSENAEAVVASAVNRVLGYMHHSTVPGDPFEDQIIQALISVLVKVPEYRVNPHLAPVQPTQHNDQRTPQPQMNQNGPQRSSSQLPPNSAGLDKLSPPIMRPTFTSGPSRSNSHSVPRPPMMVPGTKRENSGSPATPRPNGPPSASPASMPSIMNGASNGASTPGLSASEHGQITEKKETVQDAEEHKSIDRISTEGASTEVLLANEQHQFTGQKRPLEDAAGHQDFKRICTGPTPLTT